MITGLVGTHLSRGKLIGLLVDLLLNLLQNLLPLQVRCPSSKFNNKMIARSVLVEGCILVGGLHYSCAYGNLFGISPRDIVVLDALSNDDIY